MTDDNKPANSPTGGRRASFAGQTFVDLFTARARTNTNNDQSQSSAGVSQFPGSVATAAAQAQQRRMSVSALGMSPAVSGFYNPNARSESVSSSNSGSLDETAVEDGDPLSKSGPSTPFARRVSFGARALRDVRTGSLAGGATSGTNPNGRSPVVESSSPSLGTVPEAGKKTTPPIPKGRDTGYNWADSFRSRAERSSSIASASGPPNMAHVRAKSIATSQPAPPPQPPKPAPQQNVPDHFQERILKGDFYMD